MAAGAQGDSAGSGMGTVAGRMPAYLAHAGLQQRLGQPLPMDAAFTDEAGYAAPLKHWFTGRPVVMSLVYYRCAMLCPQVLHGLATSLAGTGLVPGKDYDVLVFSIDPGDTPHDAAAQKAQFLHEAGFNTGSAAGAVHFLVAGQGSIDQVAGATGFHYVQVPGPDGKMDQYAHSSVIMFATPEGSMSKYLAGIDYPPRDVRLALLGASARHISNPVDLVLLYCCSYNPAVGRYSVSVLRVLSAAAMLALLSLITMLFLLTRKPQPRGMA